MNKNEEIEYNRRASDTEVVQHNRRATDKFYPVKTEEDIKNNQYWTIGLTLNLTGVATLVHTVSRGLDSIGMLGILSTCILTSAGMGVNNYHKHKDKWLAGTQAGLYLVGWACILTIINVVLVTMGNRTSELNTKLSYILILSSTVSLIFGSVVYRMSETVMKDK